MVGAMASDPGAECREQRLAPLFPRRLWLLGPVAFAIWIVGATPWWHGWELFFYYAGPVFGISFLVALFDYLWFLLAYQGHQRSPATWLLTLFWVGIALALACSAWGTSVAWYASRLCILVSASVAILMPFICRKRL